MEYLEPQLNSNKKSYNQIDQLNQRLDELTLKNEKLMKQNADLLNNNKEAKNQIDQLNQKLDELNNKAVDSKNEMIWMKRQIERSRRIIRPLRIRQLIEQFIIKVRNDQGKPFEINYFDMKKYNLQASLYKGS